MKMGLMGRDVRLLHRSVFPSPEIGVSKLNEENPFEAQLASMLIVDSSLQPSQ